MLKRITVWALPAFFLVLNSGMLLCAIHHSLANQTVKPQQQFAGSPCKMHCTQCPQQCKNHDCTKKHSSVSIKENIQPGYSIRMHMPLLTLNYLPYARHYNFKVA